MSVTTVSAPDTANEPHDSASSPLRVSHSSYDWPLGRGWSPDTVSSIGQLPASSFASTASDATAPPSPAISTVRSTVGVPLPLPPIR